MTKPSLPALTVAASFALPALTPCSTSFCLSRIRSFRSSSSRRFCTSPLSSSPPDGVAVSPGGAPCSSAQTRDGGPSDPPLSSSRASVRIPHVDFISVPPLFVMRPHDQDRPVVHLVQQAADHTVEADPAPAGDERRAQDEEAVLPPTHLRQDLLTHRSVADAAGRLDTEERQGARPGGQEALG